MTDDGLISEANIAKLEEQRARAAAAVARLDVTIRACKALLAQQRRERAIEE